MNVEYRRWADLSKSCYNKGCMCYVCHEYPICSRLEITNHTVSKNNVIINTDRNKDV